MHALLNYKNQTVILNTLEYGKRMSLTSSLSSPSALYRKLERESYHAFHAVSPVHKSDHFFNFCVTAHSMRDFCLEYLGKVKDIDKKPFHDQWNKEPILVAAGEVANSSKHFVLRARKTKAIKVPSTKGVRIGRAKYMNVYQRSDGQFHLEPTIRAEVRIELSDGTVLPLYSFTNTVLEYWRDFLINMGIKIRRVSLRHLATLLSER